MTGYVVGLDLGSSSLKVVVTDARLAVVGRGRVGYGVDHPRPGWAEQPVARWEAALAPAIRQALASAGVAATDVVALGLAGQLDGCVAVDADGRALAPCLIWMDRRATAEVPDLPADTFQQRTGQVLDASHLAAKARWLAARHPVARLHQPVSYLVSILTGAHVMDAGLASTTNLYDLRAGAWAGDLCAAFALDPAWLPTLAPAASRAGNLTRAGAALTGLPVGIPVAVGTGDDFATPLGAGVVGPGQAFCVAGTAEVVGAVSARLVIDPGGLVETHAYPTGGFLIEHPGWPSGGTLTWLGQLVGQPDPAALVALADGIAVGADDLTFLPALTGAMTPRWDARARAGFYGLTPSHGPGHVVRAVLEALALAERDVLDRLAQLGLPDQPVLVLGGGSSNDAWAQLRADLTGRSHALTAHTDTCAVGAAMLGAVAGGLAETVRAVAPAQPAVRAIVAPAPGAAAAAAAAHRRYLELFAALTPMFAPA